MEFVSFLTKTFMDSDVMPLIEDTSASNLSAQRVEVLDLEDSKAVDYLVKCSIPPNLAKCLSILAGTSLSTA